MSDDPGRLQLQTLLSQTSVGLAASDADGRISVLSPALQHLFEMRAEPYAEDEVPERFSLHDETGERLLLPDEVPLARARAGETLTDVVITAWLEGRGLVHLRCNGAPLRDETGTIVGGIVLVQDITAERAALREQAELRARLVTTVNHELRTPLTTLFGHVELLADAADQLPPPLARSAEAALSAAESLRSLVGTVSDLVDLSDAALVVRTPTDLRPLLCHVAEDRRSAARRAGLRIVTGLEAPLVAAVDRIRLRRAVLALVDNALAFAPPGTEVRVHAWSDDELVHVEVADQGPGIPVAARPRLLEPFERGDDPHQRVSTRGLGLAVARTVGHAHGGDLELTDADPHGLRATLFFPVQPGLPAVAGGL